MPGYPALSEDYLKPDAVIKQYKVKEKIGMGGFGQIYSVIDKKTGTMYAMKVEPVPAGGAAGRTNMAMRMEMAVMRRLRNCNHICTLIYSGKTKSFTYIVMTLVGPNLADMRRRSPHNFFTVGTTFRLAIQMVESIQEIHSGGFLHRDIKPSNFAIGRESKEKRERQRVYILDFGLARPYLINKEVRRERPQGEAGFRGTVRYASLTTHHRKDMGRVDDLWSLFYVIIEFLQGALPWRQAKDKEETQKLKEKFGAQQLVEGLAEPVQKTLMTHATYLKSLGYADGPEYQKIISSFNELLTSQGIDKTGPLDWEEGWKTLEEALTEQNFEGKTSKSRRTDLDIAREGQDGEWDDLEDDNCGETLSGEKGGKKVAAK